MLSVPNVNNCYLLLWTHPVKSLLNDFSMDAAQNGNNNCIQPIQYEYNRRESENDSVEWVEWGMDEIIENKSLVFDLKQTNNGRIQIDVDPQPVYNTFFWFVRLNNCTCFSMEFRVLRTQSAFIECLFTRISFCFDGALTLTSVAVQWIPLFLRSSEREESFPYRSVLLHRSVSSNYRCWFSIFAHKTVGML